MPKLPERHPVSVDVDAVDAGAAPVVSAGNGRSPTMVRGADGRWRYEGTDVVVPGAHDVPLERGVEAFEVVPRGDQAIAVLVPAAEVEANPSLAFVSRVGKLLRGEDSADDVWKVDAAQWQEHASRPVDVDAPERGNDALRRRLAIAERDLRFAKWRLDQQSEERARAVALTAALGVTRRQAGELIGVSPGRVQQIVDDLTPQQRLIVDDLVADIERVLRAIGQSTVRADDVLVPARRGAEILDEMVELGLLKRDGDAFSVTEAGEKVELHVRTHRRGRRGSA